MLAGIGFKPSTRSPNWYRFIDIRMPGATDAILLVEDKLAKHQVPYTVKPMRRGYSNTRAPAVPSAAQWLAHNDRPSKLDRIRLVRKHNKTLRARRRDNST